MQFSTIFSKSKSVKPKIQLTITAFNLLHNFDNKLLLVRVMYILNVVVHNTYFTVVSL